MTNRAVARRPFFESRADARYFLSLVARAVRRGWIEVHCFAILVTHFHMLVRSPTGELSRALAWIQSRYVSRFNRARERDGPLVKSRFTSKPVTDPDYRLLLVGYIDWNPVDAGLCTDPFEFEHGSARRLASRRRPKWLTTAWIERQTRGAAPEPGFDRDAYTTKFRPTRKQAAMVAYRLGHPGTTDNGRELLHGSVPEVRRWLEDNARLADGQARLRAPVATVETVLETVRALERHAVPAPGTTRCDPRLRLAVGLMRQLCVVPFQEIAARLGMARARAYDHDRRHLEQLGKDAAYGRFCAELTRDIVDQDWRRRNESTRSIRSGTIRPGRDVPATDDGWRTRSGRP